jgi:hypothetical protein
MTACWWHDPSVLRAYSSDLPIVTANGLARVDIARVQEDMDRLAKAIRGRKEWHGFEELSLYGFSRLADWKREDAMDFVSRGCAPFLVRKPSQVANFAVYCRTDNGLAECFAIERRSAPDGGVTFHVGSMAFLSPVDALLTCLRKAGPVPYGLLLHFIWIAVRKQMADVCVALQPLDLPAPQTIAILEQLVDRSSLFDLALVWRLVTTIKHKHTVEQRSLYSIETTAIAHR